MDRSLLEKKPVPEKPKPVIQPTRLKIDRGIDGQIRVYKDGRPIPVKLSRCFPWTQPDRYISLRDMEDNEIALIHQLDDLDHESRRILEQALIEVGFILTIEKIENLDEDFEIRTWKVSTKNGLRSFQTRLDEWPRSVPGGGLIIRDVAGDLFYIPDPGTLDEKSRKYLWAFLDEE